MSLVRSIRALRGKLIGLNATNIRFDTLQNKIDCILESVECLRQEMGNILDLLKVKLLDSDFVDSQLKINDLMKDLQKLTQGEQSGLHQTQELNDRLTALKDPSLIEVLPGEKIRLVFFVITPEIWPSFESVYKRAQNDARFSVSVVVLKCANSEIALTSLAKAYSLLESKGVSYFTEENFSLDSYQPHVVFYPLPYDSLIPIGFKPSFVAAKGCRIAYISYGQEVGGGLFNARYQYDSEVPRVAWRIFARSEGQRINFGRYCSCGNGHVVVTGHPRIESYGSPSAITVSHPAIVKAQGRLVVLWTPHFSVLERRKWSSFLDHHEAILRLVDDRPNLFLLVRPHPFLRSSLEKLANWGVERVSAWFDAIGERDNVYLDTETDYRPAFAVSSALMADAGSFLVEYLHVGKPICHLTGKDDIGLSEEVGSFDCFYPGANDVEIASFMDRVSNGEDTLYEARKSALQNYFGPANQTPSQSILDEIAKEIGCRAARVYSTDMPSTLQHEKAFQYWIKATTTFLAPAEYYQKQEDELRAIMRRHATGRFAVDIGCGNGRFTEILSDHFEFTEGTDPSEQFIIEARENANRKGIANIAYSMERLEHAESLSTYDLVSCMGVTSSLIDDDVFIKSIWKLKAAMRPGAKLLVKDTLSLSSPELVEWDGYTAIYRNLKAYIGSFEALGLTLVEEIELAKDDDRKRTNRFFLFRQTSN